jgi:hypothetical protein
MAKTITRTGGARCDFIVWAECKLHCARAAPRTSVRYRTQPGRRDVGLFCRADLQTAAVWCTVALHSQESRRCPPRQIPAPKPPHRYRRPGRPGRSAASNEASRRARRIPASDPSKAVEGSFRFVSPTRRQGWSARTRRSSTCTSGRDRSSRWCDRLVKGRRRWPRCVIFRFPVSRRPPNTWGGHSVRKCLFPACDPAAPPSRTQEHLSRLVASD